MTGGPRSAPADVDELEDRLSVPTEGVIAALREAGDLVVLGAGGKMGPSLAVMAARAFRASGSTARVYAVSRFGTRSVVDRLEQAGCIVRPADLADPDVYATLPSAPNVIFMVGRKFGTTDGSERTWQTNVVVPALAAWRYRASRIVAFSTGNVYPFVPITSGGARETDPVAPIGEYAWSCLGRERVFAYASAAHGTPITLLRVNYAVDLRYGVLVDVAWQVQEGRPIDLTTGHVNCIWQGDANAIALEALTRAASPPFVLNVTGLDTIAIRQVAESFGCSFGRTPQFIGGETATALLSNAARMGEMFGAPPIATPTLIDWVAAWVGSGGLRLGKPTHYEQRGGDF
jgi:nucleoside-diphosphate-sugar epimerase